MSEDFATIAKIKAGDKDCFESVFKQYFAKLKYFAGQYLSDKEEAKDIAQNVLITFWEKRENLDDNTHIFSYLLTLTKNQCIDFLRKEQLALRYRQQMQDHTDLKLNLYALENFETDPLELKELEQKIRSAIHSLPLSCKNVFLMSRKRGLKNAEIAAELNLSIKTVEKKMTIALQHLRKMLPKL